MLVISRLARQMIRPSPNKFFLFLTFTISGILLFVNILVTFYGYNGDPTSIDKYASEKLVKENLRQAFISVGKY